MRRELGQLPNKLIPNFENDLPIHQSSRPSHQSNVPPKNPQFESDNAISELKSDRILKDSYQDQMSEASTNASQKENLEEEISTETNSIKEPELSTDADLSEEKKRVDELPKIYPSRVSFSSALEVSSSTLELLSPSKLKLSLITLDRKSTRLNSSHSGESRMPSSA